MDELEANLAVAHRRVAEAKLIIERQRQIIARMKLLGVATEEADDLLTLFVGSLACFEDIEKRLQRDLDANRNLAAHTKFG